MEFNIDPYYDDFQQNALDNNYMRILFKPGKAVQARELTQVQSILQNQIKQFGDHIFQDGSPVIGGNMTLDNKVSYLKLLETYNNIDIEVEDFNGTVIRNTAGTVQAKVLAVYFPSGGIPTLMVRYITGNVFADGDVIKIAGTETQAQLIASNATGDGTIVSINEGVFYADGFFVKVADQTAVVSAYSTSANVKIGLEINEELIDSDIDSSLLDPAQGSFNFQAPGADRYQFELALSTRPIDSEVDESKFFELMRVENGAVTKQVKYPVYAELEKTLARRTFDESGDYTVRPFRASLMDGTDANNYTVSIEPGKAYVKGFEFETIGTLKIDAPKPRSASDVKSLVDTDVDVSYGNFVYVTALRGSNRGFINIAGLEKIDVHCVDTSKVAVGLGTTANSQVYQNTRIGSVRVKNFIRSSADAFDARRDSNGVYALYMTDIQMNPKVVKVTAASSNANTIRFQDKMSASDNAYLNVSVTVLPIRLDAIANVNCANIFAGSYRVNGNSAVANVFTGANLAVGDIIRIADDVREVVSVNTIGDFFTVNTEFTKTIVGTNNTTNPLQVYKQTAYSQNVSSQTRYITRYDGTTKTAFLDSNYDNGGILDANSVVQLDFHMEHAESFMSGNCVSNVLVAEANASMNISINSQYVNGETVIEDKLRNILIFKLPGNFIKRSSLTNVDYRTNKFIPNKSNTTNTYIVSQAGGDLQSYEYIPFANTTASLQDNLIVVVRDNNGNTSYPNGTVLQLTTANIKGLTATSITVDTYVPDIRAVDVLINIKQDNTETKIRKKNFLSNTTYVGTRSNFTYPVAESGNTTVNVSSFGVVANIDVANGLIFLGNTQFNTVRPGDSISLFIPDVVRVRAILAGNTTSYPDANNVQDITNNFYVDYGQRDDIYEHAQLILKEGADAPTAKLLVHVDFYQHIYAAGANVAYFSVDSYANTQYETGSIPVYTSSTGTVYYLRDCLDFRPTRPIGDTGLQPFANGNTSTGMIVASVPNLPAPNETSELSFQYYLPRIDKLVLSKDKEFRVIQGKSAPQPLPPEDRDDAMTLYNIYLPPYVADIREVRTKYIENRRFTMKDISSIEKRLQKVEFFTSLNNVEKLALADKTAYEDGTEKEKYGIVGENFTNFNIANFRSEDFGVALEGGFMIPYMKVTPLDFQDIINSNTTKNKKTVSLEYTETPAITQPWATNKGVGVQPFLFGQFNGTVSLTPDTDYWASETLKPEVISVPDRVVETPTVIREIVVERSSPPTLPPPTSNAATLVITTPNTNPPSNTTATVVVSPPSDPPPVIGPSGDPPLPQPVFPTLPIEPPLPFEPPWAWGNLGFDPFNLGGIGLFGYGGTFNGDNLWLPSMPIVYEQPIVNIEAQNPYATPPIQAGGSSGISGYADASIDGGGGGKGDFDYGIWNNMER
jgi:hypothetical protein